MREETDTRRSCNAVRAPILVGRVPLILALFKASCFISVKVNSSEGKVPEREVRPRSKYVTDVQPLISDGMVEERLV